MLPPFRLERFFAQHEFSAPYLLCTSDCESLTLDELLDDKSKEAFGKLWLGYTESTGHPELRAQISQLYQTAQPDQVLVHAGAEEAIFNFVNSYLSPGDHLVVHWPCYQSLFQIAESRGCVVTKWEANPEKNWELDIDFLRDSLKPSTKAVILNLPHNPTGYWMESSRLKEVAKLVDESGAVLFLDEVYRGLEHRGDPLPAGCDLSPTAVSLGVMSKSFGLPGLRIGWIATKNRKVFEAMASFKDYVSLCNSAPSEFLATVALKKKEALLKRNREIVLRNLEALNVFFARFSDKFEWARPQAGCLAFPRLKGELSASAFCDEILKRSGVLLAPSPTFSYGDRHFRIGFGRTQNALAVEKLTDAILSQSKYL